MSKETNQAKPDVLDVEVEDKQPAQPKCVGCDVRLENKSLTKDEVVAKLTHEILRLESLTCRYYRDNCEALYDYYKAEENFYIDARVIVSQSKEKQEIFDALSKDIDYYRDSARLAKLGLIRLAEHHEAIMNAYFQVRRYVHLLEDKPAN